jgi:transposase
MEIIADNMPFGSREFLTFANDWGFEVNTARPHYPQSNGLAEKGVDICKKYYKSVMKVVRT